jgi:hypothetical protein
MATNIHEMPRVRPSAMRAWPIRRRVELMSLTFFCGIFGNWNWMHPVLRFTDPLANRVALLLLLLIPWLGVWLIWSYLGVWRRAVFVGALLPFLAYNTFCAGLVGIFDLPFALVSPSSLGFDPVDRVAFPHSAAVLYLTDCGATCSWGLELRHELQILPGLLLVRDVAGWYPAHKAVLRRVGPWELDVVIAPYANREPRVREARVRLKPFVYF